MPIFEAEEFYSDGKWNITASEIREQQRRLNAKINRKGAEEVAEIISYTSEFESGDCWENPETNVQSLDAEVIFYLRMGKNTMRSLLTKTIFVLKRKAGETLKGLLCRRSRRTSSSR